MPASSASRRPPRCHLDSHDTPPDTTSSPLLRTLFLTEPGAYLHLHNGRFKVDMDGSTRLTVPLDKVDQVTALDEGAISFAAIRALLMSGGSLLVCADSGETCSGWLTSAHDSRIELRSTQHQQQRDEAFALRMAQRLVYGKLANSRLCLRRLQRHQTVATKQVDAELADMQRRSLRATSLDAVRGFEGASARLYFSAWRELLPVPWQAHFGPRSTRPALDAVNALLSYGYAVLFQNLLTLVQQRGLDVHIGHLHALRDGHPALVSDLMEEFRALVVDTVVLHLLQDETAPPEKSCTPHTDGGVRLSRELRKRLITRLEDKLNSRLTHPLTGEKSDYRRVMRTQVGHYIQVLQGQAPHYQAFAPR